MHDGVFIGKDGVPPRSDEVHLYPFAGLELLAAAGPSGPPYAGDPRPLDFARYKISKGTFCSRIGVEPRGGPAQEKNPVGYF